MKIIWRVADPPTGRYRSFENRAWPSATINDPDGDSLGALYCDTGYDPKRVKTGDHSEITVRVADHRPHQDPNRGAWTWRTLKKRAATLTEAKELVEQFYKVHPDWLPSEN